MQNCIEANKLMTNTITCLEILTVMQQPFKIGTKVQIWNCHKNAHATVPKMHNLADLYLFQWRLKTTETC